MFRRIEDFLAGYRQLSESTAKMMTALTDENRNQPVAEGHRTLGDVAWHIVATVPEMMNRVGLGIEGLDYKAPPPATVAEIRGAYTRVSAELLEKDRAGWTDEMYGETWPRGLTLSILMSHQVHHLGQISVLLRQAGTAVPGIFGPSKEEWSQYGMEAPPY